MEPDGTYEPGFVGIRFCQECNNMLYPKEDKENRILLYASCWRSDLFVTLLPHALPSAVPELRLPAGSRQQLHLRQQNHARSGRADPDHRRRVPGPHVAPDGGPPVPECPGALGSRGQCPL
uniref:DNA-directed RNA polymerase II subunit RPB9-like zinc ribbon domain-containing protein n=1 Tax=Mus spicilegus TaxID=10103 RepID=A0A8C6GEW8_MUSSI